MADILECGHEESPHSDITRGYGTDREGNRHCYDCCKARDIADMNETGRAALYLVPTGPDDFPLSRRPKPSYKLTNWPGNLVIPVYGVHKGRHTSAGNRYDCWFTFEGRDWHAVQYGDNTQIAHCKRLKAKA